MESEAPLRDREAPSQPGGERCTGCFMNMFSEIAIGSEAPGSLGGELALDDHGAAPAVPSPSDVTLELDAAHRREVGQRNLVQWVRERRRALEQQAFADLLQCAESSAGGDVAVKADPTPAAAAAPLERGEDDRSLAPVPPTGTPTVITDKRPRMIPSLRCPSTSFSRPPSGTLLGSASGRPRRRERGTALSTTSGDVYFGGFEHGRMSGRGKAVLLSLLGEYDGQWGDGKRQGVGSFTFARFGAYEGGWGNNMREGHGTLIEPPITRLLVEDLLAADVWDADAHPKQRRSPDWPPAAECGETPRVPSPYHPVLDACWGLPWTRSESPERWPACTDHGMNLFGGGSYTGHFHADRMSGTGTYSFSSGAVYHGEFADDLFCGKGILRAAGGDVVVEGTWHDGQLHGPATIRGYRHPPPTAMSDGQAASSTTPLRNPPPSRPSGSPEQLLVRTQGPFDLSIGSCSLTAEDLDAEGCLQYYFCGQLRQGRRWGYGKWVTLGRFSYEGDWANDVPHGLGELRVVAPDGAAGTAAGPTTTCNVEDSPNAATTPGPTLCDEGGGSTQRRQCDTAAWLIYHGEWQLGVPHGYGVLEQPGGFRYEGEWSEGMRHGSGTLLDHAGGRYVGSWNRNCKHGKGKYFFPPPSTPAGSVKAPMFVTYDGEWEENTMKGKGIISYSTQPSRGSTHRLAGQWERPATALDAEWRACATHSDGSTIAPSQGPPRSPRTRRYYVLTDGSSWRRQEMEAQLPLLVSHLPCDKLPPWIRRLPVDLSVQQLLFAAKRTEDELESSTEEELQAIGIPLGPRKLLLKRLSQRL